MPQVGLCYSLSAVYHLTNGAPCTACLLNPLPLFPASKIRRQVQHPRNCRELGVTSGLTREDTPDMPFPVSDGVSLPLLCPAVPPLLQMLLLYYFLLDRNSALPLPLHSCTTTPDHHAMTEVSPAGNVGHNPVLPLFPSSRLKPSRLDWQTNPCARC